MTTNCRVVFKLSDVVSARIQVHIRDYLGPGTPLIPEALYLATLEPPNPMDVHRTVEYNPATGMLESDFDWNSVRFKILMPMLHSYKIPYQVVWTDTEQ